jgi:hypothetical protein
MEIIEEGVPGTITGLGEEKFSGEMVNPCGFRREGNNYKNK